MEPHTASLAAFPVAAPSRTLQVLAVLAMAAGLASAFFLSNVPGPPGFLALGAAFFAGGLAVWRLLCDTQTRAVRAFAAQNATIRDLHTRCEDLEDRVWELRESDERQANILGTLGDAIIRRDAQGRVVYANRAATDTFGGADAARPGDPFALPETRRGSAPDEAAPGFGDLCLDTVNGPRWFSRLDAPVRDAVTQQPLVQTVLRDVTDRRLIEEELLAARHSAESSNEAKSRFLATVSHEIRTPLNGILGMAALLRDTRLTKEQAAYIDALETSGETLLLLIDEVLDFSKVEAGKLAIQAAPVRLAPLVDGVAELLAPKAHAKGLEIAARVHPLVPETVTLDATRVRQILYNLAGNGVKFTDRGGIAMEINACPGPESGSVLSISVRDTGIGFDPDEAQRLFQEFEQVDHGPARKFGGTGLGLAIAQRLCELMGGSISAEVADGGGARFTVRLPVPETANAAPGPSESATLGGKRIVLVSTSRIECPLLSDRMALEGAHTDVLAPGDADLTDCLNRADLVFVDHAAMADPGAWLVAARLAGCLAKAVILIAPSERDRLDRLREAGFDAYLIRPVRSETMMHIVHGLTGTDSANDFWETDTHATARDGDADHEPGRPPARPLRLLVAEDNDINRLLSEALLRKLGHEPTMVADGNAAIRAAAEIQFDAILMDLHMPGVDGLEAIRQIRAREHTLNLPPAPVLVVSADVMEDARDKARRAGAAGYVTKPLTADAIRAALSALT
ncbi:MAG: response regulator [Roseibium sp.]|nr:response regulator [Roseibium sp.]